METRIAKIISYIFHPVFIPTFFIITLFFMHFGVLYLIPLWGKLLLVGMVLLFTAVFPMTFAYIFLKKGWIKSPEMDTKEERIYPLLLTAFFYYLSFYLLRQIHWSPIIPVFIFGALCSNVVLLIINFFWKISIHCMAMGGLLGAYIGIAYNYNLNIFYLISAVILLCGLVGFARLKSNSHKPAQIYAGFLTGVVVMFGIFLLL
jgi:hypothetical protein